MVFCNYKERKQIDNIRNVTILILIDGFLQSDILTDFKASDLSHNPYFNRWFSAIKNLMVFLSA